MLLLDTHVLLWLVRGEFLTEGSLQAIASAQSSARLYVSAITAWELGTAELKHSGRPELGVPPDRWFRQALRVTGARLATITLAIATEAALVPAVYGRGDPGDCFLIATARIRGLHLLTRDTAILQLSKKQPNYLSSIRS